MGNGDEIEKVAKYNVLIREKQHSTDSITSAILAMYYWSTGILLVFLTGCFAVAFSML